MLCARPNAATAAISRSTAGCRTRIQHARPRRCRAAAAITYCVRSLEPIEKNATSAKSSGAIATDGTSTMMPSGGIACATLARREPGLLLREQRGGTRILVRHGDHREHHLQIAVHRGAQQRPDLHAEDLGPRQRQPDAAQAEERVAFLDR